MDQVSMVERAEIETLSQARFRALANVSPAMFLALSFVIGAVSVVHFGRAPWWSWALVVPLFLIPKGIFWYVTLFSRRDRVPDDAGCARTMKIVGVELVIGYTLIVAWEVFIAQWATPQLMVLLALCMGGQMVFLLFGLLHLRGPTIVAAIASMIGMLIIANQARTDMVGVTILLVGGVTGLVYVALTHYRVFAHLVVSRISIEERGVEIKSLSDENFRIANTDMLTEIGNRRCCFRDLDLALDRARRDGVPVSFGIIDLDGFKTVNDSNGHLVGDRLLHAMAARLQTVLQPYGDVYRLGGDEFAFIVHGEDDRDRLLSIGDVVIAAVHRAIQIGELRLMLGCSIGFASFPRMADNATDLYDRADYALFHAKKTGRLKPVVFTEEHEKHVRENALLERTLKAADLEAELYLQFQPIVDSHEDRTLLLECLARWNSPVLGMVPPSKFIVVAEQSGLISNLTPVLLKKALDAVKQWPDEVGISFNLSGHDIVAPEKVRKLLDILIDSGVSPSRVEFEVTETALMMNLDQALANIHRLKAIGARISLDDFGTGYSSLSQIQKLPLDKIKVDASFIRDLEENEASQKIVRSVTALTRDLSLSCVVEGVETQQQLDILHGIGCRLIQGYFYSKPMREQDVNEFLDMQFDLRNAAE